MPPPGSTGGHPLEPAARPSAPRGAADAVGAAHPSRTQSGGGVLQQGAREVLLEICLR